MSSGNEADPAYYYDGEYDYLSDYSSPSPRLRHMMRSLFDGSDRPFSPRYDPDYPYIAAEHPNSPIYDPDGSFRLPDHLQSPIYVHDHDRLSEPFDHHIESSTAPVHAPRPPPNSLASGEGTRIDEVPAAVIAESLNDRLASVPGRFSSSAEEDERPDADAPAEKRPRRIVVVGPRQQDDPAPRYNFRPRSSPESSTHSLAGLVDDMSLSFKPKGRGASDDYAYSPSRSLSLKPRPRSTRRKKATAARRHLKIASKQSEPSPAVPAPTLSSDDGDRKPRLPAVSPVPSDVVRETAANTFLNSIIGSSGELPAFTFRVPDSTPPSTESAHTTDEPSSSSSSLAIYDDPDLRFRMSYVCLYRQLAPFFTGSGVPDLDPEGFHRIGDALSVAQLWYIRTLPNYPSVPAEVMAEEFGDLWNL